jgi:site-specific DNA-adenine methylase
MPNKNTFKIKPIKELIQKYNKNSFLSIDCFANRSKIAKVTNDLDTIYDTNFHLDALEFLSFFRNNSIDFILNDPPYNEYQLKNSYNRKDKSKHFDNDNKYWKKIYTEYHKKLKVGGYLLTFGWNTTGSNLPKKFEIIEILIVAHGGIHSDTICVVEKKI